jgi:4-hydroxyphenylacetate 3-monooxygenase
MLKTGAQHLASLRDGRVVYIGGERVDDVTTHPAFRNGAKSIAAIFDAKADPANRDILTFEEDGRRYSGYFLRARGREDLAFRHRVHRTIADLSYGMFGRSPDHVSSFVTGMTLKPEVFGRFADNLLAYYRHMRENDIYAVYAVVPPQAARNPDFYEKNNLPVPTLQVVREDADGVVLSGMKMLATGAVFANEIWIGNLIPLAADQVKQSITCVVPCNAKGLSLWSRKPLERDTTSDFENPLAHRFDETDSMLLCDEVKVPWSKVFVHDDATLARQIYIQTAGHAYGNHQSNVRYHGKMQLVLGVASRLTQASGADQIPAVREVLGKLAAWEATLGGIIMGQIQAAEEWPSPGFYCFNRRFVYAALNWCTENYSGIIDQLRELSGGSVFQMPADISVMHDPTLKAAFQTYWASPQMPAVDRMKLYKLVWDLVGSEFAGRHQQYEKFYAGASFVIRNYNYTHADWNAYHGVVDGLLNSYGVPEAPVAAPVLRRIGAG